MHYLKFALKHISLLCLLSFSSIAASSPFQFTYTDTISGASVGPAWNVGEEFSIVYILDNGGTSTVSQTWTSADIVSVTFNMNDAPNTITTVFSPVVPNVDIGNFVTDGTGTLTAVPGEWSDRFSPVSSTNDPDGAADVQWWVNGANQVYYHASGSSSVEMANVFLNIDPAAWSVGSAGPPPTPTYSVGGAVSGLTGSVTLQNNGGDDIIKTTNDGFTFTAQAEGSDYAVTVSSQPTGQTCTVANGSGTNITANITNITVTCVTDVVPTYIVGGTVSGLSGSGLVLQNNAGGDLAVAADGIFTFVTALADGSTYAVTVLTQPASPAQTCTVGSGSGTIATADVTNVSVACVDDVAPPAPAVPIPTLSQWALILFSTLLGLMVFVNRRRLF